jgi:hypothetical protein
MPEISKDASILIFISWRALKQAEQRNERTRIANCTVAIVFAGFFIEANLNQIIEALGKRQEMMDFLNKKNPGLQDKLAWFYHSYVAQSKLKANQAHMKELYEKLRVRFPGFCEIHKFRNDISHGNIDTSTANLIDADKLRLQAKRVTLP